MRNPRLVVENYEDTIFENDLPPKKERDNSNGVQINTELPKEDDDDFIGFTSGAIGGTISNEIVFNGDDEQSFDPQEIIRSMQEDGKEMVRICEEANNIRYEQPKSEADIKNEKALSMVIDGVAIALKEIVREATAFNPTKLVKVREYKNKAVMPKINHAKPVDKTGSGKKRFIFFLLVAVGFAVFGGVQANSLYVYKDGNVTSLLSCSFAWLMETNMPISISPLYTDVFFTAFGVWLGVLGIIGLFIYLDSDQRKQSRVGHEHGNARLGNSRDFKKYKIRFME